MGGVDTTMVWCIFEVIDRKKGKKFLGHRRMSIFSDSDPKISLKEMKITGW